MSEMTQSMAVSIERKLAKDALDVQNACNLSGVVHEFSRAMDSLWSLARYAGEGTEWVNTHPVSILYSSKIASLTGSESMPRFSAAHQWATTRSSELG